MNATLPVKNYNTTIASLMISLKKPPTTLSRILAELLKYSDGGVITHPTPVGTQICVDLGLTAYNYRKYLKQLVALELISRNHTMLILSATIKDLPRVTSLTLKQKS